MSVVGTGHNSGPVNSDRLKSFIERVERVEEDQAKLADGKRDIYSEAKAVGYDIKTMRKVVQLRKMDAADRAEQEALLETYWHALSTVDRIEARLTAGERPTAVAASEGVSRATAYRASQKVTSQNDSSEMRQPAHAPETGEVFAKNANSSGGVDGHAATGMRAADPGDASSPRAAQAGIEPGPQDANPMPAFLRRST